MQVCIVPTCFRQGVQVPLYKGKGSCSLNPDNYRGITLLSNFNKMFEILIWTRIERLWVQSRVVSDLQGACRKGTSCIHMALTLQETISKKSVRGIIRSLWHILMSRRPSIPCGWMDSSSNCTNLEYKTPCGGSCTKCTLIVLAALG